MLRRTLASAAALVAIATGAVAAPPASGAPSCPADPTNGAPQPCLVVRVSGGLDETHLFTAQDLQSPALAIQESTEYPAILAPAADPIRTLIAALPGNIDPDSVSTATVTGYNGASYTLSNTTHDLADVDDPDYPFHSLDDGPSAYPAVFVSHQVYFVWPLRAGQQSATGNLIVALPGQPMYLDVVVPSQVLHPIVTASTLTVTSGGSVDFKASVAGLTGAGHYVWDFGDGSTGAAGSAADVMHRYRGPAGTYDASVTVTTATGSGRSTPVTIRVGGPAQRRGPGSGVKHGRHPATGPLIGHGLHQGEQPTRPREGQVGTPSGGRRSRAGDVAARPRRPANHGSANRYAAHDGFVPVTGTLLGPADPPDNHRPAPAPDPPGLRVLGQRDSAPAAEVGGLADNPWPVGIGLGAGVVVLLFFGALGESGALRRRRRRRAGHSSA